ncbi:MAG: hypothetical protein ABIJ21_04790 [Nanoarchaeota archaeon]
MNSPVLWLTKPLTSMAFCTSVALFSGVVHLSIFSARTGAANKAMKKKNKMNKDIPFFNSSPQKTMKHLSY